MYGIRFPDGLRDNQRLPAPVITPTSKAFDGAHDEPLTPAEILGRGLLSPAQWDEVCARALALFARGQAMMAERGLILVDTKYEFGTDPAGAVVLADEIHTPDSCRFWRASSYEARFAAGAAPESFDKDFVRSLGGRPLRPVSRPDPGDPARTHPADGGPLHRGVRDDHWRAVPAGARAGAAAHQGELGGIPGRRAVLAAR